MLELGERDALGLWLALGESEADEEDEGLNDAEGL